jgi:Raf kinase inhibitor-like YbhB/YbcL family protein
MPDNNNSETTAMQIISPAFRDGAAIPFQYTCKGQNVSPPFNFLNVPEAAQSLALIMHDPDAPVGDYVHWTMWDIPSNTETIAANSVPVGAIQGRNSNNENKYMGPCPPSGTHRYIFELYALDKTLGVPKETTRDQLKQTMEGHIIEQNNLTGTFSAG